MKYLLPLCLLLTVGTAGQAQPLAAWQEVGYRLADAARFDSAVAHFEAVADEARASADWPRYVTAQNGTFAANMAGLRVGAALTANAQAVAAAHEHLPAAHPARVSAQADQALAALKRGDVAGADTLVPRLVAACRATDDSLLMARARYVRAVLSYYRGQYQEALTDADAALRVRRAAYGDRHREVARTYNVLGGAHDRLGNFRQAVTCYEEGLRIAQRVLSSTHPELGAFYNNIGTIFHVRGNQVRALDYFQRAISLLAPALGEQHPVVGTIKLNFGVASFSLGNHAKALATYQEILPSLSQTLGAGHPTVATLRNNLGAVYTELGQYDRAAREYRESLRQKSAQYGDTIDVRLTALYVNLAHVAARQQRYQEALSYIGRIEEAYRRASLREHPSLAEALMTSGDVHVMFQDYDAALRDFRRAIAMQRHFGRHLAVPHAYATVADLWLRQGQPDSAAAACVAGLVAGFRDYSPAGEALPDATTANLHPALVEVLTQYGRALRATYQRNHAPAPLKRALAACELGATVLDSLQRGYLSSDDRARRQERAYALYHTGVAVATDLYELTGSSQYLEAAFRFSEQNKAYQLRQIAGQVTAQQAAGVPDSVFQRELSLKTEVAYQERQRDAAATPATNTALVDARQAYYQFLEELAERYPAYYNTRFRPSVATAAAVRAQLRSGQALVSYTLADSTLYAFVLTPQRTYLRRWAVGNLPARVSQWQRHITDRGQEAYLTEAHRLYGQLWQPIESALAEVSEVVVVPDAALGYLPFEALLDRPASTAGGFSERSYLIRKYRFSYHYAAALFARPAAAPPAGRRQFLGFAPDFSDPPAGSSLLAARSAGAGDQWKALPGALREVEQIAQRVAGALLLRREATETAFKREADKYEVLHLATHAHLDENSPAYSYLLLAPDAEEDGRLHTYEIYNLNLNTKLVTLSACNTGAGRRRQGEGVMSLAHSFLHAGCPNVVMSLWPVADATTARIMDGFYGYLADGLPQHEALHRAKLDYLAEADPLTAHPYLWSSFVLIGQPEPIWQPTSYWPWLAGGVVLLAAVAGVLRYRRQRRAAVAA